MTRFEQAVDWIVLKVQRKGAGWFGPYAALERSRERADGFKHEAAAWRSRALAAERLAGRSERPNASAEALVESESLVAHWARRAGAAKID